MSNKIQALQSQARGLVPSTSGQAKTASVKGVNAALRPALVQALRNSGKFADVSAIADTRNGVKVYLALRGTILNDADYRVKIEEIAKKAGIALSITLTSGSAYQKRFRVNTLQLLAQPAGAADLFTAMATPVKGTVVIEGKTYTGLTADAIRQIQAIADRENLVEVRMVSVYNMSVQRLKVPVVVRDAITGKTPRFTFAGRWTVQTSQGVTVLAVDGQKYVLAD